MRIARIFLLVFSMEANSQPVFKTILRMPDTGVITSYTATFGEDCDYQINPPLLSLFNDKIIYDSITGLMWQRLDGGEMTYENAILYCDTLQLGSYSDWRLPSPLEALSILNLQMNNPALDTQFFTKTNAEYWWTSQRQINDSSKIWVTNSGGGIGNHLKTETISAGGLKRFHIRAVRSHMPPLFLNNHFITNNGTTHDILTDLVWTSQASMDSLTWEQALAYADTLQVGGYNDWRLPNIKELRSISLESRMNPSTDPNYFIGTSLGRFWSSTTLRGQALKAWYLNTQFGITTYDLKSSRLQVYCVRNSSSSSSINQISTSEFKVFPNPFENFIHIQSAEFPLTYKILDPHGRTVMNGQTEYEITTGSLAPGIYFLWLESVPQSIQKLIKK